MDTHRDTRLTVKPLTPTIGAEIVGIDLRENLDHATFEAIRTAWHDHAVIVVRGQELGEDDQIRLGERFGEIGHIFNPHKGKHPGLMFVSNIREDGKPIGVLPDGEMQFHSDQCYTEFPPAGTMLYGIEVPSTGGDTLFANIYAAYDTLPADVQARIETLRGVHYYDPLGEYIVQKGPISPNAMRWAHPVVHRHPITGRKALYVNRLMTYEIEGMTADEAEPLLNLLFDHQEQPHFVYQHVWRPGDVVLWDNRCTLHARTDFSTEERRLLRRITIQREIVA